MAGLQGHCRVGSDRSVLSTVRDVCRHDQPVLQSELGDNRVVTCIYIPLIMIA